MNLFDLIHATTQPYSALPREVKIHHKLYVTRSLAFDMEAQTQSNWCWAATSRSVSHYYWSGSRWTQCKVAGAELNLTTCCQAPVPDACNVGWFFAAALNRTGTLVRETESRATFAQVRAEIDAGRPVGARIGWSGGGGHMMVIYGYTRLSSGEEYFDIDDPVWGKSHMTVDEFSNNYQDTGTWTNAYFTKSPIDFMNIVPLLMNPDILLHIWEQRPLLGVKAGLPAEEILTTEGRTLGLAHAVFTLDLKTLLDGTGQAAQTSVRVMEFSGETPRAFYDVADAEKVGLRQMSATNPYLQLLPRALEAVTEMPAGERRFELRLLRLPGLNFEALWLHAGEAGEVKEDKVIPLRGFHGLAPMQALPYLEALEKLRHAAQSVNLQDDKIGY